MILQKCKELNQLLDKRKQVKADQRYIQALKSRLTTLNNFIQRITPVMGTYRLLQEKSIVEWKLDTYLSQVQNILADQYQRFQQDPDWAKEQNVLTELDRKLEWLSNHLRGSMQMAWIQYVDQHMPVIRLEFLSTLEGIPSFQKEVRRIKNILRELEGLKERLPSSNDDIEQLHSMVLLVEKTWSNLGASDIPEDVLIFLQKTAEPTGAPLDAYTESVSNWLNEHGLAHYFGIKIKNVTA